MADTKSAEATPEKKPREFQVEPPVVKHHESGGLSYTTTCGRMPLRNAEDEIVAQMFFCAYHLGHGQPDPKRKLVFAFNGGPGSPSLWLHLGALGPKRIPMVNDGHIPPPPYELVDNDATWLTEADIVFIDPIGTGFSEAKDEKTLEGYLGMKGDIESIVEFIRLYLTHYQRFGSEIFLAGESYGTTRAAGIAHNLINYGIGVSGVILISMVLAFNTLHVEWGNDLPYILFLPTYATTAWYHKRLDSKRYPDLRKLIAEVKDFAEGEYATALMKGDRLSEKDRLAIRQRLADYTGLSPEFLRLNRERIEIMRFCSELRRDEDTIVGRLDSRIPGPAMDPGAQTMLADPSMSAIMPPYMMTMMGYFAGPLGYETHLEYKIFKTFNKWKWDMPEGGSPDTSEFLSKAMAKNPHLRVYVASGYYDLATPFFATEFTLAHMNLADRINRVTVEEFEAGHMMYTHDGCLAQLKTSVSKFISGTE